MVDEKKELEELLSANDAGKLLGVSGKTIIRMMENGDFPGYRIGSAWKFKREDVVQYRESRKFERGKAGKSEEAA